MATAEQTRDGSLTPDERGGILLRECGKFARATPVSRTSEPSCLHFSDRLRHGHRASPHSAEGRSATNRRPVARSIGVFGTLVTFGLFLYELRQIDVCKQLRNHAAWIEGELGIGAGQFGGRRGRLSLSDVYSPRRHRERERSGVRRAPFGRGQETETAERSDVQEERKNMFHTRSSERRRPATSSTTPSAPLQSRGGCRISPGSSDPDPPEALTPAHPHVSKASQ